MSNQEENTRSREERLQSLEKALAEMRAPEDLDMQAIFDAAVGRFWADKGEPLKDPSLLNVTTVPILRGMASWLGDASAPTRAFWSEFWKEVALVVVPVVLAVLSLAVPTALGHPPAAWLPAAGISLSAAGLLWLFAMLQSRDRSLPRFAALRHSAGAMFSGLVLAAGIGSLLFFQQQRSIGMSLNAAGSELRALALADLGVLRLHGDLPEEASFTRHSIRIQRMASATGESAYQAVSPSLPGKLIATLDRSTLEGKVVWLQGNKEVDLDTLAWGCIQEIGRGEIALKSISGKRIELKPEAPYAVSNLVRGDCVSVAFDPATGVTTSIHEVTNLEPEPLESGPGGGQAETKSPALQNSAG